MKKISARSIPIYTANLATVEESWIFGSPKRPFWTFPAPKRDMIYKIWRPSLFLAHFASLMSRWPLLRGAGLHIILSWETTNFCRVRTVYSNSSYARPIIMIGWDLLKPPSSIRFASWQKIILCTLGDHPCETFFFCNSIKETSLLIWLAGIV